MKISIIGMGAVGTDIAQHILLIGECQELVLVNRSPEKALGETLDFRHVSALTFAKNTQVISGDYVSTGGSDIIIITAGAQIKPGQSRQDLVNVNTPILIEMANELYRHSPDAKVIVVTNPCDLLTHFIIKNSSYTTEQVISAGTVIDTARLMSILGEHVNIDPKNIFGMVFGEHGLDCLIPWSLLRIAGLPVEEFCTLNGLPPIDQETLAEKVKMAGYEILELKNNTNHAIAASVFRIIRAISMNERSVLPVGTLLNGEYGIYDVTLNVPVVVSAKGVDHILNYTLRRDEYEQLRAIASHLRATIEKVGKTLNINY